MSNFRDRSPIRNGGRFRDGGRPGPFGNNNSAGGRGRMDDRPGGRPDWRDRERGGPDGEFGGTGPDFNRGSPGGVRPQSGYGRGGGPAPGYGRGPGDSDFGRGGPEFGRGPQGSDFGRNVPNFPRCPDSDFGRGPSQVPNRDGPDRSRGGSAGDQRWQDSARESLPAAVPNEARTNDCELIVTHKSVTDYAEFIEHRLKKQGLTVDILFPNEEVPLGRVLANIANRGTLYAIVVTPLSEEHRSVTVNILYGQTQEHRNIPFEDGLLLISRNFESYMRGDKLPIAPGSGGVPVSASGLPLGGKHPDVIQSLLHLLVENKPLTVLQYDKLISYLQEKRSMQLKIELGEGLSAAGIVSDVYMEYNHVCDTGSVPAAPYIRRDDDRRDMSISKRSPVRKEEDDVRRIRKNRSRSRSRSRSRNARKIIKERSPSFEVVYPEKSRRQSLPKSRNVSPKNRNSSSSRKEYIDPILETHNWRDKVRSKAWRDTVAHSVKEIKAARENNRPNHPDLTHHHRTVDNAMRIEDYALIETHKRILGK